MIKEVCFIKKVKDIDNNTDYEQKKYIYEIQN